MTDIAYFRKNNIIDTEDAKTVRDYYKKDYMRDFKLLYVIKSPDEKWSLISVAEDLKWSPYSERGRLIIGYFREGESFPRITNVSDIDYNEPAAEAELVDMAVEDDEFAQMIKDGSYYRIEEYLANLNEVPYIILSRHDLKHVAELIDNVKEAV